jgi:preprotein translocase subunit SecD
MDVNRDWSARTLGVTAMAAAMLCGCAHGGAPLPTPTHATSTAVGIAATLRIEVADANVERTEAIAGILDTRLKALGVPSASVETKPGVVTFGLPRRLTGDEMSALTAIGHVVFRPVLQNLAPNAAQGPDCTSPTNRASLGLTYRDDGENAIACAEDGTAKYVLAPAELTGSAVRSARAEAPGASQSEWRVEVAMVSAARWANVTEKYVGQQIAIVLDGVVQSAPTINERLPDGKATISGSFTEAEARELAAVLVSGALTAPVVASQTS